MVAPCGQSTAMPIDIKETFFVTGDKTLKPCPQEYCHAGNIFTSWAGGAEDCIADTSKLLEGDSKVQLILLIAPGTRVTDSIMK